VIVSVFKKPSFAALLPGEILPERYLPVSRPWRRAVIIRKVKMTYPVVKHFKDYPLGVVKVVFGAEVVPQTQRASSV